MKIPAIRFSSDFFLVVTSLVTTDSTFFSRSGSAACGRGILELPGNSVVMTLYS